MTDVREDHAGTVSIGGRTITNLNFADDIDGLAGTETEVINLVERLDKTSTAYGMQISAEKTKLMANNINGISSTIKVSGEKLETVQSFKYLGAIVTDEGSSPEILSRIAQLQKALWQLIQRTVYERRGSKQNRASHWTLQRTLDHCETTQTAVVWAHYKIFGPCQDISPGHCAR